TNHERDSALRKLRRGEIEHRLRLAIEPSAARRAVTPTDVANDAHDFMAAAVELENSPDGIRGGPEPSGEAFADNRDERRPVLIRRTELASRQERHTERSKEARAHDLF